MKKLLQFIGCLLGIHDWTCKAGEGIKATNQQLNSYGGFKEYATMYCKHCKKISKLSLVLIAFVFMSEVNAQSAPECIAVPLAYPYVHADLNNNNTPLIDTIESTVYADSVMKSYRAYSDSMEIQNPCCISQFYEYYIDLNNDYYFRKKRNSLWTLEWYQDEYTTIDVTLGITIELLAARLMKNSIDYAKLRQEFSEYKRNNPPRK